VAIKIGVHALLILSYIHPVKRNPVVSLETFRRLQDHCLAPILLENVCCWIVCLCVLVVYLGDDDSPSEPDFQYIPDTPSLASVGGDPLTASMTLLKDGLDTGTTVAQFEVSHKEGSVFPGPMRKLYL